MKWNLTREQWDAEMVRSLNRIYDIPSVKEIQRLNMGSMTVEELAEWISNRFEHTSFEAGMRIAKQLKAQASTKTE